MSGDACKNNNPGRIAIQNKGTNLMWQPDRNPNRILQRVLRDAKPLKQAKNPKCTGLYTYSFNCLIPRTYTTDLNACQEAIGALSGPGYKAFCCFLLEIVGNTDEALTATAVQRADALSRAFGVNS